MFGYFALNAAMTSSFGGNSLGSPQKDQVIVADWAFAAAGALVGAGAFAAAVGAGALAVPALWQAANSEADAAPSPATGENRSTARRESRADHGCNSLIFDSTRH